MKILAYGDSVRVQTGYSRQSQHILSYFMSKGHRVRQIAFQHAEPMEYVLLKDGVVEVWPPATIDAFASKTILTHMMSGYADMVYASNDIFTCSPLIEDAKEAGQPLFLANYGVIDTPDAGEYFKDTLLKINVPVTPSKFGFNQLQGIRPDGLYIPHGVDLDLYKPYPLDKNVLKSKFNLQDRFIYGVVGRNIPRKMIPLIIESFTNLKYRHGLKDISLLMITDVNEPFGTNLKQLATTKKLSFSWEPPRPTDIVVHPHHLNYLISLDEQTLAEAYNMMDVLVSASVSEGFGLPTLEGAACGTPSVAGNHSANTELIEGHGWLYDPIKLSNGKIFYMKNINKETGYSYPITDQYGLEMSMLEAYNHSSDRELFSKKCVEFAQQYSWNRVLPLWDEVLARAEKNIGERKNG